ncbi:MAG TPA: NAD(P)H-dependent oxidoreductase, partial [Telluria sp.]|nr:NAD(P)H-dependent oxidoreductase [Telluria sp.]
KPPIILAFAGSLREESYNRKLLKVAVAHAREAGATVVEVDLRDFLLPLYDGDHESAFGVPAAARQLRRLMLDCDGMLVASPEYNGSVSGVLKNTLDWCSRPAGDGAALEPYAGKPVALMAASVSAYGGVRGLGHLRAIFGKLGATVLGEEVALPLAAGAFEADGQLVVAASQQIVGKVAASLVRLASVAGRP